MDSRASWCWEEHARPLREDTVLLPEVLLEDMTTDPQRSLLPLFNRVGWPWVFGVCSAGEVEQLKQVTALAHGHQASL